jgi:hypothetical protein
MLLTRGRLMGRQSSRQLRQAPQNFIEVPSVELTTFLQEISLQTSMEILKKTSEAGTVYNFDTIDVDKKPEVQFKC